MATSSEQSGGVGFFGLLAIVFIGLKLCGVIDWSWWWVLAPLWTGVVITLICITIIVITSSRK